MNDQGLPSIQNLYAETTRDSEGEVIEELLRGKAFRLERIVSSGQATPEGEWYDQEEDEWVIVLTGKAQLRFEGQKDICALGPGDTLRIPAHCRHRVEYTAADVPTTWLAVHYRDSDENISQENNRQ